MKEDQSFPDKEFDNILKENHKKAYSNINTSLYNEIVKASNKIEGTEDENLVAETVKNLRERFKEEDLNQVTNIFIYCQRFLSTNDNHVPMPSQLCLSLGRLFTEENLHYAAAKVYNEDQMVSGCALSFVGYLGMVDIHTSYVLQFIEENFEGFSPNNKTECIFQLKATLKDNKTAQEIIAKSGITEYRLQFGTDSNSISTPVKFNLTSASKNDTNKATPPEKIPNQEVPKTPKPWWKFWA
jgi:hypothetical protein